MWVIGGYGDNYSNLNDVWYSSDGKSWTRMQGVPWIGRHASTVISYDNSLWMIAGSSGSSIYSLDDVWKLTYGQ